MRLITRLCISIVFALSIVLAVLASVFDDLPAAAAGQSTPQRASALALENELLARQVELASEEEFYLVLDPAQRRMSLMLQGVVVSEYEIQDVRMGRPRRWFRTNAEPASWSDTVWCAGVLSPARRHERLEIVAPASGSVENSKPPAIPPTPEEAIPVPSRFRIRYSGGLAIEVVTGIHADRPKWREFLAGVSALLRDKPSVFFGAGRDKLRLRITMKPEDAAALYRSIPPDTKLIVLRHPE